jgi:putative DNA primase/helicase
MAILTGAISGNLEIIDVDNFDVFEPWLRKVKERAPGLLTRLVWVTTPRPGVHLYYRCATIGGSEKLARVPERDEKTGKVKPKTIIETKGEGGYCLAPPSPAACHPRDKCYVFVGGKDLTMVPQITPEERAILLDAARSLNTWQPPVRPVPKRVRPTRPGAAVDGRPGDDFNARADWADILTPHGWHCVGADADGCEHWCRPGKSDGSSATVNHQGHDLLYIFSVNADPFEENTGYTKFHAYALLEHDGDFIAAAKALAAKGYGSPRFSAGRRSRKQTDQRFSRYAHYSTHTKAGGR